VQHRHGQDELPRADAAAALRASLPCLDGLLVGLDQGLCLVHDARALAALDVLASSAEVAARRRYTRPVPHDGDELEIVQGRHPVIEAFINEPFVPNNVYLNNSTDRLLMRKYNADPPISRRPRTAARFGRQCVPTG